MNGASNRTPEPPWRFEARALAPLLRHARDAPFPPPAGVRGLVCLRTPWPHLVSAARPPDLIAFHGALPVPRVAMASSGRARRPEAPAPPRPTWSGAPADGWLITLERWPDPDTLEEPGMPTQWQLEPPAHGLPHGRIRPCHPDGSR